MLLQDPAKGWAAHWQDYETAAYRLSINNASDAIVRVPSRAYLQFPTLIFKKVTYRICSLHHDLEGHGAWKSIAGEREEIEGGVRFTVHGQVSDLEVVQEVVATETTVTFKWDARVVDPGVEVYWLRFDGRFFQCTGDRFRLRMSNGKRLKGTIGDPFASQHNVKSAEIESRKERVTIRFLRGRCDQFFPNPRIKQEHQRHIPLLYNVEPEGLHGMQSLVPGKRFGFTMRVFVERLARDSEKAKR